MLHSIPLHSLIHFYTYFYFFTLYSTILRPHVEFAFSREAPKNKKEMDMLEQVQKWSIKIIRGLEHLCSEDSLRQGGCSAWRREAFREK